MFELPTDRLPGQDQFSQPLKLTSTYDLCKHYHRFSSTLYEHTYTNDPAAHRLYLIAKNVLKRHEQHELKFTESLNVICSDNEKIFRKSEAAIKGIPGASKARKLIKRGLNTMHQ